MLNLPSFNRVFRARRRASAPRSGKRRRGGSHEAPLPVKLIGRPILRLMLLGQEAPLDISNIDRKFDISVADRGGTKRARIIRNYRDENISRRSFAQLKRREILSQLQIHEPQKTP